MFFIKNAKRTRRKNARWEISTVVFNSWPNFYTSSEIWLLQRMKETKRMRQSYSRTFSTMTFAEFQRLQLSSMRRAHIANSFCMMRLSLPIWWLICLRNIRRARYSRFRLKERRRSRNPAKMSTATIKRTRRKKILIPISLISSGIPWMMMIA